MRRARIALALVTLALAICVPAAARAAQGSTRVSGIGVLDYTMKPKFKVGDYVRYRVTSYDLHDDPVETYNLTLMIASQEVWWGERCFFVESWVEDGSQLRTATATLMSYTIFEDPTPEMNVELYMRKTVLGVLPDGAGLDEVLVTPKGSALRSRSDLSQPHSLKQDTVGVDTVQTPAGLLHAVKLFRHQAWGNTGGSGDSTVYKERIEDRTRWVCDAVPLTRTGHDETVTSESRRAWLIGHSQDARPAQLMGTGRLVARLIGYGHGLRSRLLPPDRIHSFDESPAGRKPATGTRTRKSTGVANR